MSDTFILASPLTGWVTRLDDVPDPVFAECMLGDGVAIDPMGNTLYARCAGDVLTVNEARLPTRSPRNVRTAGRAQMTTLIIGPGKWRCRAQAG